MTITGCTWPTGLHAYVDGACTRCGAVKPTPEQVELDAAVQHLAEVIARVVPSTTAHYAVEQTRRALEELAPRALTVTTRDAR